MNFRNLNLVVWLLEMILVFFFFVLGIGDVNFVVFEDVLFRDKLKYMGKFIWRKLFEFV